MHYRKRFLIEPGTKGKLGKIAPEFKDQHNESHGSATREIQKHVERLAKAQYLLYADGRHPKRLRLIIRRRQEIAFRTPAREHQG
ncbi:MAG: hypothetical protein ACLQDV_01540 [Candidatus Binataceae bacterium]